MNKPLDRMALYEAPRISHAGRPMVEVELKAKGYRRDIKSAKLMVRIPLTNPLPEIISYEGRIFVHRTDGKYIEASIWPVIRELDT